MASNMEQLQTDMQVLNTKIIPLKEQLSAYQKAATEIHASVRKYMERNNLSEYVFCGIRYRLEEDTSVKCTIDRMRATLPEDIVKQYVQENSVTETKFRKRKLPPP